MKQIPPTRKPTYLRAHNSNAKFKRRHTQDCQSTGFRCQEECPLLPLLQSNHCSSSSARASFHLPLPNASREGAPAVRPLFSSTGCTAAWPLKLK